MKRRVGNFKKKTFKFCSHNFISPIVGSFIVESSIQKVYASKKRASSIITIIICKHLKFRSREDEKNATNANNLALSRRPSTECSSEIFFCGWRAHTKWCKLSCDVTYDDIHMQPSDVRQKRYEFSRRSSQDVKELARTRWEECLCRRVSRCCRSTKRIARLYFRRRKQRLLFKLETAARKLYICSDYSVRVCTHILASILIWNNIKRKIEV